MSNPGAWANLDSQKTTDNVNHLQNIVDSAARYLVSTVNSSNTVIEATENIQLEIKDLSEQSQLTSKLGQTKSEISVKLPSKANDTVVVLKTFKNLGCILNGQKSCHVPSSVKKQVNSQVSTILINRYQVFKFYFRLLVLIFIAKSHEKRFGKM